MRPFLKWAGNKYQIIERVKAALPPGDRLVEPFVGSGAVFLNTNYPRYYLGEGNGDLVNLYKLIKREGQEFIDYSRDLFIPENNLEEQYYDFRIKFNRSKNQRRRAALFIYLNKHCFNGLCRYNSQGGFNVPFGQFKQPYFPEKEMQLFHKRSKKATFTQADFLVTMSKAKKGDVVYCDPPYAPLTETANFTQYHSKKFDEPQQIILAEKAKELSAKGIPVVISNHDTPFTRKLYKGAELIKFTVQRYISCDGANRTKVPELIAIYK